MALGFSGAGSGNCDAFCEIDHDEINQRRERCDEESASECRLEKYLQRQLNDDM